MRQMDGWLVREDTRKASIGMLDELLGMYGNMKRREEDRSGWRYRLPCTADGRTSKRDSALQNAMMAFKIIIILRKKNPSAISYF